MSNSKKTSAKSEEPGNIVPPPLVTPAPKYVTLKAFEAIIKRLVIAERKIAKLEKENDRIHGR